MIIVPIVPTAWREPFEGTRGCGDHNRWPNEMEGSCDRAGCLAADCHCALAWSIGQLPGASHAGGVARVLAATSAEGGPSLPAMTAVTRQR